MSDKMTLLVLMVLLLAFKALDINGWKYDMLRSHHSKGYITSHYRGFGEWTLFTKSIKEIGIILPIVNFFIIISFFLYGGLMLLAVKHYDVSYYVAVGSVAFAFYCIVTTVVTFHNYSALGIGLKSNGVNYGERILSTVVFTVIMCILAYFKSRGVLF